MACVKGSNAEKTNAIVMAAGLGTRMVPLTKTTPKPLVSVNGTPMIETVINALVTAVQITIANCLAVLGISAPETM